jgi:hypothetical protein
LPSFAAASSSTSTTTAAPTAAPTATATATATATPTPTALTVADPCAICGRAGFLCACLSRAHCC